MKGKSGISLNRRAPCTLMIGAKIRRRLKSAGPGLLVVGILLQYLHFGCQTEVKALIIGFSFWYYN